MPGLAPVFVNGARRTGMVYQSKKGGITPEIFAHAIEHVWLPCFEAPTEEFKLLFLVDGHDSRLAPMVVELCRRRRVIGFRVVLVAFVLV